MHVTRRAFAAGFGGTAGALALNPARVAAQDTGAAIPAKLAPALAAIWAYAEQHRQFMGLPALTVGLSIPGGPPITRHFGFAELGARTPLTDQTLFQIGSISKLLTGILIHQFVAEGRLKLSDQVAVVLPDLPFPKGDGITIQHLLDHVSGLPGDAPLFPEGGLWTGFKPGTHWSYSNTGYDALGKIVEHVGGRPLARLLHDRIFKPLGMTNTKGAIVADDRTRYAQGYEQADYMAPFMRGAPLAPSSWVDVTFAAGSTVSTASDMIVLMRAIATAAAGKGGLGLSPAGALEFTKHAVATETPTMRYGNGFMHVTAGGKTYLHHTGGMVSFSSAFHVDPTTGAGAFSSSSLSGLAGYRPRALTLFAVDAINAAMAGRPIPVAPSLAIKVDKGADFVGTYSGPAGSFAVKPATDGLTLVADGIEAPLENVGGDSFKTSHPRFNDFGILFERMADKKVGGAGWGGESFVKAGATWRPAPSDPALAKLAGRFVNDSPWWGGGFVVERGGKLWFGTDGRLTKIGENLWRVGEDDWSPERLRFDDYIDGRPQTMIFSGEKFIRHDI